jgi:glycosyltransferase involved in cell wall biosynthesis
MGEPGRVGIVYPRSNLDTVPSLVNMVELLAGAGYAVDLYTWLAADGSRPVFASPHVSVRPLGVEDKPAPASAAWRRALRRGGWVGRVVRRPLARGYHALRARALRRAPALSAGAGGRDAAPTSLVTGTVCVLGVDPDGLALAAELARPGGVALAYYSLELLPWADITTEADRRAKEREVELSRQAAFVVVQDAERAELLSRDNGLDPARIVCVPNAPLGPARRRPSRYWHERFGLRPDQRVALHAGSLGAWTGIDAIVDSVPSWPPGWVLVVHTRYHAADSEYVERLRARATPGRAFFSLQPVPRADYDRLVDGADAALAFYVRSPDSAFTGRNIETIGLSSGKIAYGLRAGVPPVVNRATSIAALLEREGGGVVVDDAGGLAAALARIDAERERLSRQACAFFDRHLDVASAFGRVLERLAMLPRPGLALVP